MTLVELQNILGNQVNAILKMDNETPMDEQNQIFARADEINKLAKNMVNNADIILRADKLVAEGKIRCCNIIGVVGGETAKAVGEDG